MVKRNFLLLLSEISLFWRTSCPRDFSFTPKCYQDISLNFSSIYPYQIFANFVQHFQEIFLTFFQNLRLRKFFQVFSKYSHSLIKIYRRKETVFLGWLGSLVKIQRVIENVAFLRFFIFLDGVNWRFKYILPKFFANFTTLLEVWTFLENS